MDNIVRQPGTTGTQNRFADLPVADVERSTFDRSHGWKSTLPLAGRIYPCFIDEMVPGDSVSMKASAFVRLSTPLKPIMDQLHIQIHFFSVANRLVYPEFPNMMGEQKTINDDISQYTIPQVSLDMSTAYDTTADYFGLPAGQDGTIEVSDLPFRSYMLIWNDWYRDENLQDPIDPFTMTNQQRLAIRTRAKTKDYFTSALPWAQKGDQVIIPLGEFAEVVTQDPEVGGTTYWTDKSDGTEWYLQSNPTSGVITNQGGSNPPGTVGDNRLWADLSAATATSINDLRTAFQIQRLLERDARSGTRYVETVFAHFGVESDDRRQFRPEYLGGGTAPMQINPVASTVPTTETPQGELAAVGTGVSTCNFSHSFTEHSQLLGLISIKSDLTYQQGVDKMWLRKTRYDFYYPVFAHLGEQTILNKELYFDGTAADDEVWGYQERWSEMRYKAGRVCGQFRSSYSASLDVWHLAQDFVALPGLNGLFISDAPPVDRVVAVPTEPHFLCDMWFDYKHTRPMPVYSVPGLVDHF